MLMTIEIDKPSPLEQRECNTHNGVQKTACQPVSVLKREFDNALDQPKMNRRQVDDIRKVVKTQAINKCHVGARGRSCGDTNLPCVMLEIDAQAALQIGRNLA